MTEKKEITGELQIQYQYCSMKLAAEKFLQNSTAENKTGIKTCQFMTKLLQDTGASGNIQLIKLSLDDEEKTRLEIVLNDGKTDFISIPDAEGETVVNNVLKYWVKKRKNLIKKRLYTNRNT